jgi:hypothetical protein
MNAEKKLTEGWIRGLAEGLTGSGFVLGVMAPIAMFVVFVTVVIGVVMYVRGCTADDKPPKPCTSYSYKMDLIGDSEAKCTRWPAMKMRYENRWVKADIVHCTCTAESDSLPEEN